MDGNGGLERTLKVDLRLDRLSLHLFHWFHQGDAAGNTFPTPTSFGGHGFFFCFLAWSRLFLSRSLVHRAT